VDLQNALNPQGATGFHFGFLSAGPSNRTYKDLSFVCLKTARPESLPMETKAAGPYLSTFFKAAYHKKLTFALINIKRKRLHAVLQRFPELFMIDLERIKT